MNVCLMLVLILPRQISVSIALISFVCEKIAYTERSVVAITDVIENTITGIKGIGGLKLGGSIERVILSHLIYKIHIIRS
jgi:hypothetical protein